MPMYERLVDGEVAERVQTVDGSHEDTRLGVAVLEHKGGWRLEGAPPAAQEQGNQEQGNQEQGEPSTEGGEDGVRDSDRAGRAPRARPRAG